MYESTRTPGKKFGSSMVGKRYDSYSAGDQPEVESTPKEHGSDQVNSNDSSDKMKNVHAEDAHVETPSATLAAHGPAHTIHYGHDHENNVHTVHSEHEDGHTTESSHSSTADAYGHGKALAYEAGGEEQATSPKKRDHRDQQLADSEDRNYEEFDTE
jgi:hypothetical protein